MERRGATTTESPPRRRGSSQLLLPHVVVVAPVVRHRWLAACTSAAGQQTSCLCALWKSLSHKNKGKVENFGHAKENRSGCGQARRLIIRHVGRGGGLGVWRVHGAQRGRPREVRGVWASARHHRRCDQRAVGAVACGGGGVGVRRVHAAQPRVHMQCVRRRTPRRAAPLGVRLVHAGECAGARRLHGVRSRARLATQRSAVARGCRATRRCGRFACAVGGAASGGQAACKDSVCVGRVRPPH